MNKILKAKNLPVLALVTGLLGFVLRMLIVNVELEEGGLYPPQTMAWALYWLMSGLLVVAIILMSRPLKYAGTFEDNFPPSLPAAIGSGIGAAGLLIGAIPLLSNSTDTVALLTGYTGILAAICLAVVAVARFQGKPPFFLCHLSVSLHTVLRIFEDCRLWSNETQLGIFMPMLMALICVLLASYYLTPFDVGLGSRRGSLLWSLLSVHFCLTALADRTDMVFYGTMALWLITNLCSLRPLKQPEPPAQAPPEEDPTPADRPSVSDMTLDELNAWLDQK